MRRRPFIAVLIALLAMVTGLPNIACAAEPVFPLGVRIGLEPQAGLTLSKRFPGFEDIDQKVTVTILDLPARAYEDFERSAFDKNQVNLTDLKRESFPYNEGIGFLISGQKRENGAILHKWFLLGTPTGRAFQDLTMLINVEVPEAARGIYTDAVIRKVLSSATFRPQPLQEQLGLVPFKLNDLAGFRVMQVLPTGGVILTDGPGNDIAKQPYVIVAVEPGAPNETSDRGKFARELVETAPLRDIAVTLAEPMRIIGGQGYEVRAQAKGLGGEPVSLVQWLRFGGGGHLRIVGVGPRDAWDNLFTRFRAVRDGVELK
ncbi:MAG: hypothetical protein ABI830_08565 [Pseudolabrys sp.]